MAKQEVGAKPPADRKTSFLGLHRTRLTSQEHRHFITVARQAMLDDALEHLRKSIKRKSKHHFLFIGGRGSGKTHLLSLIEDKILQDSELRSHLAVARFPDESSRILSFADFLLRLCEILAIQFPEEKTWTILYKKLETENDDARIIDSIVPTLRQANRDLERTVLIMLENVHEIFEKQMKERSDVGAFRKFLMDNNGCQLIATAPIHFAGISSVEEPFFDFFDVQLLDPLTKEQSFELVIKNLKWEQRTNLLQGFEELRPKLAAFHDLTSGNPRLTHMLCETIADDSMPEIGEQFQRLLDRATPFYSDRLKELAPRERALLETLSLMRDDSEPKTPKRISEKLRISEQQTSSLLKRLSQSGYIKSFQNPKDKRSRLYTINEGFFDLWLATSLSDKIRKRLPILIEFLTMFYSTRRTSSENSQPSYLEEINQLIEQWVWHRCGDLEVFAEHFAAKDIALTAESFGDAKIAYLREQLLSVTEPYQRIELRIHLGKLLKKKGYWKDAVTEYREAIKEGQSLEFHEMIATALDELTQTLALGESEENAAITTHRQRK